MNNPLQLELLTLRKEHEELELYCAKVIELDEIARQRMKLRRLQLKERISALEAQLNPNIIA